MADKTSIEWTDATWNPITGCSVVSPGCTNCYAMRLAGTRLRNQPSRAGLTIDSKAGPVWSGEVRFNERAVLQPLSWKQPRMIFVCAHGDLFHESVPDAWIDQVFAVMALAPQHTFQVLTKRSDRMRSYLADLRVVRRIYELVSDKVIEERYRVVLIAPGMEDPGLAKNFPRIHLETWPLPNVWLGVSVEDQRRADKRIPDLLATPAAIRWISVEPLLGPIDFYRTSATMPSTDHPWKNGPILQGIHWIVAGGESGPSARPMHPAWARALRDQCAAADVPFLLKQWGEFRPCTKRELGHACGATKVETAGADPAFLLKVGKKRAGRELDGVIHDAFPALREVPAL